MDRPVHREALANGMTVLARESEGAGVVAMTLLVRVGSRDERPEDNGVTALLGRVLLKGTRRRTALQIAQAAEDAGGYLESGVDQEYAEVSARGLGRHWRDLLGLVHELVTEPSLDPDEVEREREALLAQIRGLDDQPFQVASRLLSRTLFGPRGYGLPASGQAETVRGLGRESLFRHLEAFYTPDRMILAVSGAVPAREVVAEAAGLFGPAPRGPDRPAPDPPPDRPAGRRAGEARDVQQAHLLMGFLAPPAGHPDHVALKVANTLLGGGMSSRLFRVLRDEGGLAYSVGSVYPSRRQGGRVVAHIGTDPASLAAAESGIRSVVGGVGAEEASAEELARAKAVLGGGFALDVRTSARQSFFLGFFELLGLGAGYLARYPELIEAVTGADVRRVAARYLVDPAVVVVGPG